MITQSCLYGSLLKVFKSFKVCEFVYIFKISNCCLKLVCLIIYCRFFIIGYQSIIRIHAFDINCSCQLCSRLRSALYNLNNTIIQSCALDVSFMQTTSLSGVAGYFALYSWVYRSSSKKVYYIPVTKRGMHKNQDITLVCIENQIENIDYRNCLLYNQNLAMHGLDKDNKKNRHVGCRFTSTS